MGTTALLVETGCGGHHTVYSKTMLEGGYDGYFLVSSETWESLPAATRETHKATVHVVPPGLAWDRKKQVDLIFEFFQEHSEVTRCFILSYADVFFPLLRRLFKIGGEARDVSISGLWNADDLFESRRQSPKRLLRWWSLCGVLAAMLTLSPRMQLLFLNGELAQALHLFPWLRTRARWCPEPLDLAESRHAVAPRKTQSVPPCLLFAGYHLERKGTTWALETLSSWTKPLRVVVAGPLENPKLTNELVSKLPSCIAATFDSRRLSGSELAAHFRASDFVALPYRKFGGSSSIFIHALQNGKPTLVTDYGMMGRQVRALECGRVFRSEDRADFLRQLDLLLNTPLDLSKSPKIAAFLAQRAPAAFYRTILATTQNLADPARHSIK